MKINRDEVARKTAQRAGLRKYDWQRVGAGGFRRRQDHGGQVFAWPASPVNQRPGGDLRRHGRNIL